MAYRFLGVKLLPGTHHLFLGIGRMFLGTPKLFLGTSWLLGTTQPFLGTLEQFLGMPKSERTHSFKRSAPLPDSGPGMLRGGHSWRSLAEMVTSLLQG